MNLDEAKCLVQEARWFSNLGCADTHPGFSAVTDLQEWSAFISRGVRAEFNLPNVDRSTVRGPLWQMNWLPTSPGEDDPIHGGSLKARAEVLNKSAELRTARLEMHRLAQVSMRQFGEPALLHFGAIDLTRAATGAALFACRQAASEVVVAEPSFWCSLLPFYREGNWPLGITLMGDIMVL